MKKMLSMFLALSLVLALAPAFASTQTEVKEITWLIGGSGTTSNAENPVLDAIYEATGVKVKVIQVAPGDLEAKLNTMIASNQLPDLFTVNASDAVEFIGEGMLASIGDLIKQYGPNIQKELGEYIPQSPANQVDGNIYMIPGYGIAYTNNLSVRVDWLKKLGLDMPTDLDSLYDVLYAFTYGDPDGNGVQDTVGIVTTMTQDNQWEHLFGAFGIAYNSPTMLADGSVTTYMKDEHYLEAIQYLRKLYQAGVMDQEFASMPAMTAHERLWTGRCGVYGFQNVGTTNNWYPGRYTLEVPEDPADMFGFTVIEGPYGDKGSPKRYKNVTQGFVVSSTAKHPEAVIQFLDYLSTEEGDTLTYLGVEGLMYKWTDKANGKYERLGEYTDDATHRANGGFTYWMTIPAMHCELQTMNKLTRAGQTFAVENAFDWPKIYSVFPAITEYGATLDGITKEALAQLIVTTGDVEKEYAEFVSRWENEGGLEWETQATAAYAAEHAQ